MSSQIEQELGIYSNYKIMWARYDLQKHFSMIAFPFSRSGFSFCRLSTLLTWTAAFFLKCSTLSFSSTSVARIWLLPQFLTNIPARLWLHVPLFPWKIFCNCQTLADSISLLGYLLCNFPSVTFGKNMVKRQNMTKLCPKNEGPNIYELIINWYKVYIG